jgi:hypothetical protein
MLASSSDRQIIIYTGQTVHFEKTSYSTLFLFFITDTYDEI